MGDSKQFEESVMHDQSGSFQPKKPLLACRNFPLAVVIILNADECGILRSSVGGFYRFRVGAVELGETFGK